MENKNEQVHQEEWGTQQSLNDPKRELLSSIGLFIGTGLLGFWFGVGAPLSARWLTVWKNL